MREPTMIYDKAMHEARKYWRDRLDAMSFAGHLALDHPRLKDAPRQLAALERTLDPEVHALLRRLSGGNPFLAYTALVAALRICCQRISGEPGVTIFSPAASPGAAGTLVPISGTLDGGAAFKAVLLATKELLSGAIRNQQYPFSRLLIDLPDERRPRQLPLIAAMAGFHEEIPDTPYDLAVRFEATADRVQAAFRFDARLYDEATIRHFAELFEGVLRQGLANPSARIADLPPEPFRETGDVPPPPVVVAGVRLHELIESQAARNPENLAVIDRGRETSCGALQRAAEGLAETLAGLALDARRPIVILMDASTGMIVSMLAVLRIGAAFAPLKLLSTRGGPLGGILEALDSPCILCQPEHVADLQRLTAGPAGLRHIVTVDHLSFQIAVQGEAPPPGAAPESAPLLPEGGETACVLVDGREGGRPPSLVTHAELVSRFQWLNGVCGIGPGDRCLLSPGLGASEQLYDTLGVLSAGAGVEIPDAEDLKSTSLLTERLLAPAVTVWDLPTPLAQNLLGDLLARHAGGSLPRGPRNILLSGEKQCASLAEELARCFPEARITGLYAGPAGGLWTTFFPLRQAAEAAEDAAEPHDDVIARAIPGVEHQVLHGSGEPAPLHTRGELHLRSLLSPSAPTLRTGLRAKALGRDRIAWLRGDDHAFLKHGCSVELTGIEAALCRQEHIRAAEVLAVKAEPAAGPRVVAFVIADPERLSAEAAAEHLVLRGDVDLIPDRFVVLDEFPLTAEGAIDRDALIARFVASPQPEVDGAGIAADEIHRQLKGIWLDILEVDDVADDDSFFARGGNSLKATLLIARILDEFNVDLSVQKFFREPSTRAVAQLIAAESANATTLKQGPDFKIVSRERYRVQLPEMER